MAEKILGTAYERTMWFDKETNKKIFCLLYHDQVQIKVFCKEINNSLFSDGRR